MSIVNLDFLRSGAEFKPVPIAEKTPEKTAATSETPRTTRNRKLDAFYKATLEAFKTTSANSTTTEPKRSDVAGPAMIAERATMVNLDFLRSGAEFKQTSTAMPPTTTATTTAIWNDTMPSPRTTRNERLAKFYRESLAAAHAKADFGEMDTPAAVVVPSVVNVDFLRSGAEFNVSNVSMPKQSVGSDTRGTLRSRRLDAFHDKTLAAFKSGDTLPSDRSQDSTATRTVESIVNVDFLRSGAEFNKPLTEMPVATTVSNTNTNTSVPTLRTTRNERLARFHSLSLAAAQDADGVKTPLRR